MKLELKSHRTNCSFTEQRKKKKNSRILKYLGNNCLKCFLIVARMKLTWVINLSIRKIIRLKVIAVLQNHTKKVNI